MWPMSPARVIAAVEASGPAAKAAVQPGDVIVKVGDLAIADSAALASALAGKTANDNLALELKDRIGTAKKADVKVLMTPRLIGMNDQTLLANRILLDVRMRLMSPTGPVEESILRLNAAAALARVQAWSEARTELQKVKLPEGPGRRQRDRARPPRPVRGQSGQSQRGGNRLAHRGFVRELPDRGRAAGQGAGRVEDCRARPPRARLARTES